ncbi:MAG: ribonuclease III [Crocinitomicaceae bacterium]|nr:ribonuclease III [Crocinitomicaceae bacterium]
MINKFGYRPKDISLFKIALTHKSYSNDKEHLESNERLEFLGDSIIDAIVANLLFEKFPEEDEGYLTKLKSKIVSRNSLSDIGNNLDIGKHIFYKKGRSINMATLEGNAFEALIGAIYLDSNYDTARKCLLNHVFRNFVDLNKTISEEIDFKSKLFIFSQKNKLELNFEIVSEEHNGKQIVYEALVILNNREWGKGKGTSKKKAEQMASKETLVLMGELQN